MMGGGGIDRMLIDFRKENEKNGCLLFTKRFRKIRLETKWNMTFWVIPSPGRFPGVTEHLKR